jgi:hypothetical protein
MEELSPIYFGKIFIIKTILKSPHLPVGVFYMSKNTYMDLFGNQEIYLIFVEIKTGKLKTV